MKRINISNKEIERDIINLNLTPIDWNNPATGYPIDWNKEMDAALDSEIG